MNEEKFRKVNQFNKCFRAEDSPSILCICGESGSGKSTLAKRFLNIGNLMKIFIRQLFLTEMEYDILLPLI